MFATIIKMHWRNCACLLLYRKKLRFCMVLN